MNRYRGNQLVEPGVYVNPRQLSFESLRQDGRLPGSARDHYRRVSPIILLLAAPVLGGLYVVFLPVIGLAMLAWLAGAKAVQLVSHAAAASARVLRPGWTPGGAFLSKGKQATNATRHEDPWLEEKKEQLRRSEGGQDDT